MMDEEVTMNHSRNIYYAHTHKKDKALWQTMTEHGSNVSTLARIRALAFGEETRAKLMGQLHDIGKYGELFQRRLEGEGSGLDHWSAGAAIALETYRDIGMALAIQGHHIGLQNGDPNYLVKMQLQHVEQHHPLGLRLTETNLEFLKQRLEVDLGVLPPSSTATVIPQKTASSMLDTRFLFSSLVDSDFLDTERTMNQANPEYVWRPEAEPLEAQKALAVLERFLEVKNADQKLPEKTRKLRDQLSKVCRDAALTSEHLYTLTAPTGTGKTLAMLRFALMRASQNKQIRRIIAVLPFLSILDQTVKIYREVFAEFGEHYILEHHSLTGTKSEEKPSDEQNLRAKQARLLTQNWDAPIVITTSVQLLESLHANRPSACRKLHNIAGSIVLIDEAQTLPVNLAVPTLKTLSRLASKKYETTVVFATATQPAFDHLHEKVLETENSGWNPTEIVPDDLQLFDQAKRVKLDWRIERATPWSELIQELAEEKNDQVLCIVNLKRHARVIAEGLRKTFAAKQDKLDGLYHLSTALCPTHRLVVLKKIIEALNPEKPKPCRLVATQCVEAGVDLDFPRAFRALGPFDAIAQAAGRCNRNDLRTREESILTIFKPEPDEIKYPTPTYRIATEATETLLNMNHGVLEIDNPENFREFYKLLYSLTATDSLDMAQAIKLQDYVKVNELYRLIDNNTYNVVVPYKKDANDLTAENLMREARNDGINPDWMRRARGYTVTMYRTKDGAIPAFLEQVPYRLAKIEGFADDWFLCRSPKLYDDLFGFQPELEKGGYSSEPM
jgi:CRISPR-associated endonuclease/helicase Cas3